MPLHLLASRAALALLATALAVLTVAGATAAAGVPQPDVPPRIQVEDGHKPYLLAHATGVQIYTCSSTAAGPKWRLLAPRATLYGDNGQLIGTHFGGPTWQARDGSFVKAQRVDGVTVDPDAIPWLLLKATTQSAGPDGDRLAATTFIQRISTTGGMEPPAADCNDATAGSEREIPYTADYRFWKANSD
jgi:Protein of unknown function (DUF3455)